jgi:predicted 2-oxoglutarate/Fe(II)-dependent dioxygenase YbiX
MCEQMNVLNAQGFVHLPNFLDKDNCAQLTDELKKLVGKGATTKDSQCPKSQAVHGALVFDSLLEQLVPNFELVSGKKLYPTYAYARLYAPGEQLHHHTDRESCELTATITLGFEGDVWPIYMGDFADEGVGRKVTTQGGEEKWLTNEAKIEMQVGDAAFYYGMNKDHWREPYTEGKWQAQVFLHYVDANGPYAEWKYDKRGKLSHHDQVVQRDYTYLAVTDAMSPEAARKLIDSLEAQAQGEQAQIGMGAEGVVNKTIRDVKRITLPSYRGIGATMAGIGLAANADAWRFDILGANQTDYLKYDSEGHYKAHIDTFINPDDQQTRKLTILMFLNDDFEGGRLFLQNGHEKIYPPQEPGTAIVFPSFIVHGVEPVTKGIRRSIVTWLVGPWFK